MAMEPFRTGVVFWLERRGVDRAVPMPTTKTGGASDTCDHHHRKFSVRARWGRWHRSAGGL